MQLIQTVTVGSGGASAIVFSSLPATFTDLYVLVSEKNASANDVALYIAFNGSSSSFSIRRLFGTGSSVGTQAFSERIAGASQNANMTANTFSNTAIYIPNYASSNNKSYSADSVTENNATGSYQFIIAGLWSNTSAISSLSLAPNGGSFAQYSSASLYGIKSGSDAIVTVS